MNVNEKSRRFEELTLPHLDAAYNFARWLTRSASDADDVVQESYLRAFRFFDGFDGNNARSWLLTIVRNTWFSEWRRRRDEPAETPYDEVLHGDARFPGWVEESGCDPERLAIQRDDVLLIHRALDKLAIEYREVLVLRELEDMSYRDIATVVHIPMGTVMSRLARGRRLLCAAVRAAQAAAHSEVAPDWVRRGVPLAGVPTPSKSQGVEKWKTTVRQTP